MDMSQSLSSKRRAEASVMSNKSRQGLEGWEELGLLYNANLHHPQGS